MAFIELSEDYSGQPLIMIFCEGTILKPKSFINQYNLNSYIPVGASLDLIRGWVEQGAEIIYCTSLKKNKVKIIMNRLSQYGFPGSKLCYREPGQNYKDIVEEMKPDILIEDDCKSIGGSKQMCITYVNDELKQNIKSIIVKEFQGIDDLPGEVNRLKEVHLP